MSKQRASKQRVENTIDFIQSLTLESCEKFIKDSENVEHIELSKDDQLAVVEALEREPQVNEKLMNAAKKHKEIIDSEPMLSNNTTELTDNDKD